MCIFITHDSCKELFYEILVPVTKNFSSFIQKHRHNQGFMDQYGLCLVINMIKYQFHVLMFYIEMWLM